MKAAAIVQNATKAIAPFYDDDVSPAANVFTEAADETTGDRSEWRLFIHGIEIGVESNCEGCRDRFIEIYERAVRHAPDDDTGPISLKCVGDQSRRSTCC